MALDIRFNVNDFADTNLKKFAEYALSLAENGNKDNRVRLDGDNFTNDGNTHALFRAKSVKNENAAVREKFRAALTNEMTSRAGYLRDIGKELRDSDYNSFGKPLTLRRIVEVMNKISDMKDTANLRAQTTRVLTENRADLEITGTKIEKGMNTVMTRLIDKGVVNPTDQDIINEFKAFAVGFYYRDNSDKLPEEVGSMLAMGNAAEAANYFDVVRDQQVFPAKMDELKATFEKDYAAQFPGDNLERLNTTHVQAILENIALAKQLSLDLGKIRAFGKMNDKNSLGEWIFVHSKMPGHVDKNTAMGLVSTLESFLRNFNVALKLSQEKGKMKEFFETIDDPSCIQARTAALEAFLVKLSDDQDFKVEGVEHSENEQLMDVFTAEGAIVFKELEGNTSAVKFLNRLVDRLNGQKFMDGKEKRIVRSNLVYEFSSQIVNWLGLDDDRDPEDIKKYDKIYAKNHPAA